MVSWLYLFAQIANQGIPRDINTREYLDTWSQILSLNIGQVIRINKYVESMRVYEIKEMDLEVMQLYRQTVVFKLFKSFDGTLELFILR